MEPSRHFPLHSILKPTLRPTPFGCKPRTNTTPRWKGVWLVTLTNLNEIATGVATVSGTIFVVGGTDPFNIENFCRIRTAWGRSPTNGRVMVNRSSTAEPSRTEWMEWTAWMVPGCDPVIGWQVCSPSRVTMMM